jgi:glutaconate CoA-transferase subunit A
LRWRYAQVRVLKEVEGRLFTDPDPDKARDFFREKSRKMTSKLMTLSQTISEFVRDGDYLAIGGFGANRTPIAACHEIVRQGRKNMGFAGHTSTHDSQILAAGEVFNRVDVAYIVGLEARGPSPCARRYVESGKVEVGEWTN